MVNKLEIYGHNGNKQILYFSGKQEFNEAEEIINQRGNASWAAIALADYVIEIDVDGLVPIEKLIKCRYPWGLEAILDAFMEKQK